MTQIQSEASLEQCSELRICSRMASVIKKKHMVSVHPRPTDLAPKGDWNQGKDVLRKYPWMILIHTLI